MPWKLQISFWRGLTRPRRFPFAFVTSVSNTCMLSELYFQEFCVVLSWVLSLGWPLTFWGLYKAPSCNTWEDNLKLSLLRVCFLLLSVLPVRECSVLLDSSTPLVDSRVEEVSSVDSEPNPSWRWRFVDLSHCSSLFLRWGCVTNTIKSWQRYPCRMTCISTNKVMVPSMVE